MWIRIKELIFSSPFAFYTILFAAFPALFLYAYNISIASARDMWLDMAVSVGAALIVWALLGLLLRDARKAALAAGLLIIFFYSYGRIYDALAAWNFSIPWHPYLLSIMLFIWAYCVYFIKVAHYDFKRLTVILNVAAGALIVFNLLSIGWYEINRPKPAEPEVVPTAATTAAIQSDNSSAIKPGPDIYYIILDEYAHPDTMKQYYDYDDSWFIKSLSDKGFIVTEGSRSKTHETLISISSTLNMQYVDPATREENVARLMDENKVAAFLKSRGYQYIFIGGTPFKADLFYNYYEMGRTGDKLSDYNRMLIKTSMLRPFLSYFDSSEFDNLYRRGINNALAELRRMPSLPGKKFVFAHIMCPHSFFVFGPNGEFIPPKDWDNYVDKQYYLGQYIYISRQIYSVLSDILDSGAWPPIIVLQSDHGLRPHVPGFDVNDQWEKILNAYYLPGGGNEQIYSTISPVNSFRVIFNYYFGQNYPLLKD